MPALFQPIRSSSASPNVELGIEVLLDRPEEVGADRVVNAVAGKDRYKGPLIIVDLGTATTFDVVDGDGNYSAASSRRDQSVAGRAGLAAAKLPSVAHRAHRPCHRQATR